MNILDIIRTKTQKPKSVLIVIAKFNEDMDWVKQLRYNYKIYDKSKDIPNVGREAETYLRYIIENYNNLPNYVVFLQGRPFDHLKEENVDFINTSIDSLNNTDHVVNLRDLADESHNLYTRTTESFTALFDSPLPNRFSISYGAQYIVPKSCILNRKREFYEVIRNVMVNVNNTEESRTNCLVCPWSMERMWLYIFDKNIKVKDVQYSDLL
jgi:hypothetical protein